MIDKKRIREYIHTQGPLKKSRNNILLLAVFFLVFSPSAVLAAKLEQAPTVLEWSQLPPLPDPIGLAGPFVGVSNDVVIIAGGDKFRLRQRLRRDKLGSFWVRFGFVWVRFGFVWVRFSQLTKCPFGRNPLLIL